MAMGTSNNSRSIRQPSNMGILTRSRTQKATSKLSSEPMTCEGDFPNHYTIEELLRGVPGEYEALAREVLSEIDSYDFSVLPFEDSFPFRKFLSDNMFISLSPLPGMLFPSEEALYLKLKKVEQTDRTLKTPFDHEATLERLRNLSAEEKRDILLDTQRFNRELLEELTEVGELSGILAERWRSGGDLLLSDLEDFDRTWKSLFNDVTAWDSDGTIRMIKKTTGLIVDTFQNLEMTKTQGSDNTIIKLGGLKKYLREKEIITGEVDAIADYLDYWGGKATVKRDEVMQGLIRGGYYGQIFRNGGSYDPYRESVDISFNTSIRADLAGSNRERFQLPILETSGIAEIGAQVAKNPELRRFMAQEMLATMLHEYAHHVSMSSRRSETGIDFERWHETYAKLGDFPSEYAATDPAEGYAECFAYHWIKHFLKPGDEPHFRETDTGVVDAVALPFLDK
jgi:hypothetical protein